MLSMPVTADGRDGRIAPMFRTVGISVYGFRKSDGRIKSIQRMFRPTQLTKLHLLSFCKPYSRNCSTYTPNLERTPTSTLHQRGQPCIHQRRSITFRPQTPGRLTSQKQQSPTTCTARLRILHAKSQLPPDHRASTPKMTFSTRQKTAIWTRHLLISTQQPGREPS